MTAEPKDPYRKGKAQTIVQHAYRDGWIVWNWTTAKWDYMNTKLEKAAALAAPA